MQDFLATTFYGNTMGQWAIALAIAVAALLVGKTVYWITSGVIRRATKNTDTEFDDLLVDTIDEPIVVIVTVLGFWVAVQTLTLPQSVQDFLWNAIQAAMVLAITWTIARLWDAFAQGVLAPMAAKSDSDLDDQLLPIVRRGGKSALWILGVILALNNAGYDVAALLAGVGIGGIALAMAAKDLSANVFGGVTIFTDRPFALNDRIIISGIDGMVSEIGIRSTRMRTLAGTEVTIPNSRFADSPVENVSREPSRKVVLNLGLTYDTSPNGMSRAMEILGEIIDECAEDMAEGTTIAFNAFGDFTLGILLIYYIRPGSDIMGVQTSVNMAILERFNAEGLEFAFPTIHSVPGG